MAQIIPAILEKTKEKFLEKIFLVSKLHGADRIQVDFGDGQFTEEKLLDADEMDTLNPAFSWEAHLMVKEPKDFLDYKICGFKTLILHYEAFLSADDLKQALLDIKTMGFQSGIAVNPETPINVLQNISADQYLLMSVIPGRQGNAFIPATIEKIKQLRQMLPHAIIEVDGGINETNIKSVKDAGADLICVGSSLVKATDSASAYARLEDKIK